MSKPSRLESLWKKLLDSTNISTDTQKANVLMFGNPKSGKKSLIRAMLSHLGQSNDVSGLGEAATDSKTFLEKVYLVDYNYCKVNEFLEEDATEVGKLNFHLLNSKYKDFPRLLESSSLRNLVIAIVLDLEEPERLTESFIEWINFVSDTLVNHLSELPHEMRAEMAESFEANAIRNKQIFAEGGEEVVYEEPPDVTFSLQIPLLIVANKADTLDNLSEQKALDYVQFKLRSLAVTYGAGLIYVSPKLGQNVDTLLQYLSFSMLGSKNMQLKVNLTNEKLFVPFGFDQLDMLQDHFKECQDFLFARVVEDKREEEGNDFEDKEEIVDIEEFLKNLKDGEFKYTDKTVKEVKNTRGPSKSMFKTRKIIEMLGEKGKKANI